LPTGIRFKVRFTQPIDTATASGGDTVKATLEGAIRDASSRKVLAGEGAEILARITRLEQIAGAKASIRMEVKLESVRVGGSLVALPAVARPGPDAEEAAIRPLASGDPPCIWDNLLRQCKSESRWAACTRIRVCTSLSSPVRSRDL